MLRLRWPQLRQLLSNSRQTSHSSSTRPPTVIKSQKERQQQLAHYGLYQTADNIVRWKKISPDHPRNWSSKRKAYDIGVIVLLDFWALVEGSVSYYNPTYSLRARGVQEVTSDIGQR